MKKMLAILLALLMMLTGMATAEETTDNNTNIAICWNCASAWISSCAATAL